MTFPTPKKKTPITLLPQRKTLRHRVGLALLNGCQASPIVIGAWEELTLHLADFGGAVTHEILRLHNWFDSLC